MEFRIDGPIPSLRSRHFDHYDIKVLFTSD
jgi:hypothetical protein